MAIDPKTILNASADASLAGYKHNLQQVPILTGNTTIYVTEITESITEEIKVEKIVGGHDTQIQFNDSGAANATAGFTFNKTSNTISVGNSTVNTVANGASILPGILALNNQNINDNFTIPVNTSTVLAGPITVATGKLLTVSAGSRLVVV